jgi:ribosomal protein L40E
MEFMLGDFVVLGVAVVLLLINIYFINKKEIINSIIKNKCRRCRSVDVTTTLNVISKTKKEVCLKCHACNNKDTIIYKTEEEVFETIRQNLNKRKED